MDERDMMRLIDERLQDARRANNVAAYHDAIALRDFVHTTTQSIEDMRAGQRDFEHIRLRSQRECNDRIAAAIASVGPLRQEEWIGEKPSFGERPKTEQAPSPRKIAKSMSRVADQIKRMEEKIAQLEAQLAKLKADHDARIAHSRARGVKDEWLQRTIQTHQLQVESSESSISMMRDSLNSIKSAFKNHDFDDVDDDDDDDRKDLC